MSLRAYRRRLPIIVLIVLALICLGLIGFACACFTDHPMQAVVNALAAIPLLPALVELWPVSVAVAALFAAVLVARRVPVSARSPAALQRFLL